VLTSPEPESAVCILYANIYLQYALKSTHDMYVTYIFICIHTFILFFNMYIISLFTITWIREMRFETHVLTISKVKY
jgi:hypothetical protein